MTERKEERKKKLGKKRKKKNYTFDLIEHMILDHLVDPVLLKLEIYVILCKTKS